MTQSLSPEGSTELDRKPHVFEGVANGPPKLRFDADEAERAYDAWKFNCGPSSVSALLEMTPEEVRPHLLDFEKKGYTNPTLMLSILDRLKMAGKVRDHQLSRSLLWPRFGLCRVQWAGPWTKPGVPIKARYRKTHWVATWKPHGAPLAMIFDVNAVGVGGWLSEVEWSTALVPWLLKQCEPRATGEWWITHAIAIVKT